MQLRPYQQAGVNEIRAALRASRSCLYVLPTGGGKTVLVASMMESARQRGKRCFFLVHRQELVEQTSKTLRNSEIPHGVIAAGYQSNDALLQVVSVQTLVRRMDKHAAPDLLFLDEAHHAPGATWQKIIAQYPNAFRVGVTATPQRLDNKGLNGAFDSLVLGPSVERLIEDGFLSRYTVFSPPCDLSLESIKMRGSDYDSTALEERVSRSSAVGDAVKNYLFHLAGKRAIAFCVSVKESKRTAQAFLDAGIKAAHVDGCTPASDRAFIMAEFARGNINVLCNVDLISEGFDVPSCEGVIMLRPTQSLSLYLQQAGRALRPFDGKEQAIIIDHVGNCGRFKNGNFIYKHGFPCDEREWSLAGSARQKRGQPSERALRIIQCETCFSYYEPAPACPQCGAPNTMKERKPMQWVDGELMKAEKRKAEERIKTQKKLEERRAKSLADFMAIEQARGYKRGWAERRWELRASRMEASHGE